MCPPLVALCDTAPRRFAWPPLPAPLSANQPMRRHLRPAEVRLPPRPLAAMAAPPPVRLQDSIPPCAPPAEVHCLPFELESGDTTESAVVRHHGVPGCLVAWFRTSKNKNRGISQLVSPWGAIKWH